MKRIITLALSILMIVTAFTFVVPASAQDNGVMFSFNYQNACNGVVDGKKTAKTEKVTIDGVKALKIVPTPDTALAPELRLDCYSISYPASQLKGAKYMTVTYRYDGMPELTQPMRIVFLTGGGAFSKSVAVTANEATKSGAWSVATFDVSALNNVLVEEDDKVFKQFHFWPYGLGVDPKELTANDVMYIGEITFSSKAPEGTTLPTTTQPTTPSTPATPSIDSALTGDENGLLVSFNYQNACNGVVDGKKTVTTEKVTIDEVKAVKITPNAETALANNIALDSYSIYYTPNQIANARYMVIKYKYVAPEGDAQLNLMGIRFLGSSARVITGSMEANTIAPIKEGEWALAIFNVSQFKELLNTEDKSHLFQFHLYPFGVGANPKNLSGHVMYISDISLYTINPDPNTIYEVAFKNGHPEIEGENPMPLKLKKGDKVVLPEITYEIGAAEFLGWKCSEDNKYYQPGEEYIMPDNNILFTADFNVEANLGDYIAIDFVQYQNGSCDGRKNVTITEDVFQGKSVVKIVPNPTSPDAKQGVIIDGYSYASAGIDLDVYKYLVITYYLDGTLPNDGYLYANILPNGKVLTKVHGKKSEQPVTSGRWNFATLDFTTIDESLNPETTDHVLRQMHIHPFNGVDITTLTGEETLYINSLMFFKEKPDLAIHESYMKGYEGGLFQPQGNMTRAEAATIVARLSAGDDASVPTDKTTAFADVPADQWYYKYISYVESLGYLGSYSGTYEPNKAITRAEFVELVYNMGLLSDKGLNGTFTDVAANHPKAAVIAAAGKAGLVNGYANGDGTFSFRPDNTITRAEVVKVINNAYGRSITADQISAEVEHSFHDVPVDFWAYADIMEATLAHVEDSNGWTFCMVSPYSIFGKTNDNLNYAAAEQYVKDLDATTAERIAAIKNTPNMDLSAITGKKVYVSATGDDANDGLTEATPVKTFAKANTLVKAGDAVLIKRGDMWRERFVAVGGVTYTAYGEGAKPVLYGSPENGTGADKWTLHYEDQATGKKIWVYANELLDVGSIICDNGKVIGLKEVPDLVNGKFYVRNSKPATTFDMIAEFDENYEFFSNIPSTSLDTAKGKVYFRCDEGNPGELFSQIEFNIKGSVIHNGGNNTTIDNLCIMYTGTHGISSGTTKNLTVTNCDIGWIGGTIQSYNSDGKATRLGNGIEIYGGCDGFLVDNNYIWQCYDAGVTHQYSTGGTTDISMYNIVYSNNVIEDCIYNIEYFNGRADSIMTVRDGKNFVIKNNILRRAGYGWGNQRPDTNTSAHIKSWTHSNEYEKGTFIIENNVFDRAAWNLVQTSATYAVWCPIYKNNVYVQVVGEGLAEHAGLDLAFDCYAEESIIFELGDETPEVYFLPESYKHQGFLTRE